MKKTQKKSKRVSVTKKSKNIISKSKKHGKIIVAVSGGFDPIHIGHVRMFQKAKAFGHELVVIINNDNWLKDKKGYVFMPQDERKEIIESIRGVDRVVFTKHEPGEYFRDRSVCRALREVKPHIFANGGDRKPSGDPVPEVQVCEELGIEMVYNIGHGGKIQSSSWLADKLRKSKEEQSKSKKR